ncbi:MAG TPA: tRNA (N6-isopentenyl adenosine(37)-C2)-methylthiotransferase MiaB [Acidobacteria bacterium]|jgi:tRNA-2-methylthio-N6-dimethylallyladenosine synthase|nr:tRNA (N6-isopentenyl adenosine(37)-C2)-methylthiotransferase MiaB [Acidobacteriota bacterium]
MNFHDSERMAGLLEAAGYARVEDATEADVVVLNTCSVRERAEEKLFSRLGEVRADRAGDHALIAVTGCVAQQQGGEIFKRAGSVDVVVGTQAMRRLPELLDEAGATGAPQIDVNPYDDVSFPLGMAVRGDSVKAYVTIVEGCNDFCTFCVVPYTRGHERMRPAAEITREVEEAVSTGRREIQLLGQIVNHYHAPDDPACDFAELLRRVHGVRGVERIRFASPHPRHVTPRMIAAMRDLPSVCRHLHLPVQSGSTRVLASMHRRHTRDEYLELVAQIRAAIPDIALSTDTIVGFPGETDADFEETLSLVKQVGYHSMFSFKYSARPATMASKRLRDTVPEAEKTRRIVALQELQRGIQLRLHEQAVGTRVTVLADDRSRRRSDELSGRTSGNTVVNFPGRPEWLGRMLDVTVQKAGPNSLWGVPA